MSQHLVFALHLHAAIFITLALQRIAAFARNPVVVGIVDVASLIFVVAYALTAFRRVYGEGWVPVVMKSAGIAALYFVAGVTGLIAALAVAALAG